MRTGSQPARGAGSRWSGSRRDWLIAFLLTLATIQCVRADFLINETFIHWDSYAAGTEAMPYQGRAGMVPILRAAGSSPAFRALAHRFAETVTIGSRHQEPFTVEKVASVAAGLLSLSAMMATAFWWSRRRRLQPWWLTNLLVLLVTTVTLVMRATQNFWYAYDLPHAALFGCAILLAMEGVWPFALLLFAFDVPMRETSLFLVPVFVGLLRTQLRGQARRPATLFAAALLALWAALHFGAVRTLPAATTGAAASHTAENLHQLLYPHHWPQLFSAGGYLILFVWLERKRLKFPDRWVMYAALLCLPLTLFYGVWTETRVWLEWTLPIAALGAIQLADWIHAERTSIPQPAQ